VEKASRESVLEKALTRIAVGRRLARIGVGKSLDADRCWKTPHAMRLRKEPSVESLLDDTQYRIVLAHGFPGRRLFSGWAVNILRMVGLGSLNAVFNNHLLVNWDWLDRHGDFKSNASVFRRADPTNPRLFSVDVR
jgi:hypothetical protein